MTSTDTVEQSYELKLTRVREVGESRPITGPEEAAEYWHEVIEERSWFHQTREHVVTLLLDNRRNIVGHHLVSIGTLNECLAHPRDILGPVLCGAAQFFILMHNHPSGDPSPSQADHSLTKRINEGANLLCVEMADHVVIGAQKRFFSFREAGLL